MKDKNKFSNTISSLLYSWGGDTPEEAIWTCNDLFEWVEAEFSIKLTPFNENPDFKKFEEELYAQ